jgi:glycerol-3-phosphate O-acyltransferase / dihydroxyacetone phosphate acyltransferase
MALGSLAANPDSGLKIVCCGMNYFHAHKFRSRAVVEFGAPIEVPKELVDLYRSGERREATRQLLEIIYHGLLAVTVTSPDYDSLMMIQAVRRLYKPKGKKLPLPMIVELNRRLAQGYQQYKDDPRIINLKKSVLEYNKQLWLLGIRDHQVEYAKLSIPVVVFTLIYRVLKLGVLAIGTLPGLILFAPVFIASKMISIKKSKEALAASTVKLQGRDVVATWKLLVAMGLAPLLYNFYTWLLVYWTYKNRIQGYVPQWVPLWSVVVLGYVIFPMITFAALRIGEIGMDILKSLRPLVLSLNPTSANTLFRLRKKREQLTTEVTDLINTLGPEMFDDFEHSRLVADPFRQGILQEPTSPIGSPTHSRTTSYVSNKADEEEVPSEENVQSAAHGVLPRNESFHDISSMGIFASRPASRSRSRQGSRANMFSSLTALTTKDNSKDDSTKESLDEVSKRIRGAMHERTKRSRRQSEGSWEFAESDDEGKDTPVGEEAKKDI